jgi:hypothetical protein
MYFVTPRLTFNATSRSFGTDPHSKKKFEPYFLFFFVDHIINEFFGIFMLPLSQMKDALYSREIGPNLTVINPHQRKVSAFPLFNLFFPMKKPFGLAFIVHMVGYCRIIC